MGVSGKWIKALIGLNKSEKPQSLQKDGHVGIYFYCPIFSSEDYIIVFYFLIGVLLLPVLSDTVA